jgi:spermidine synthase
MSTPPRPRVSFRGSRGDDVAAGPRSTTVASVLVSLRRWGVPLLAALALATIFRPRSEPTVLFEQPSPQGVIQVVEQPDGLRELYLTPGGARQTALYLSEPKRLVLDYTRVAMVALELVPEDGRMLFIGLGGGAMPTYVRWVRPDARIDAVDIDPVVVRVAQEWFGFRPSSRVRAFVGDGAEFVAAAPEARWDWIMLDAFGPDGVPEALISAAFVADVRRVLRPDGVVAVNLHTNSQAHAVMLQSLAVAFRHIVRIRVPGYRQEIVLAGDGDNLADADAVRELVP